MKTDDEGREPRIMRSVSDDSGRYLEPRRAGLRSNQSDCHQGHRFSQLSRVLSGHKIRIEPPLLPAIQHACRALTSALDP